MEDPMMDPIDVLTWFVAGLMAGGMAGAIWPGMTRVARGATLTAGALSALAGGWLANNLVGISAMSFLGSVCIGVLGAVLTSGLLRRRAA
jgi:uncharacterized membrane protein YeaQ/YmgE (transglycosylase-associated protein family)